MGAKAILCTDTDDHPVLDLEYWRQRMIILFKISMSHGTVFRRAAYELID